MRVAERALHGYPCLTVRQLGGRLRVGALILVLYSACGVDDRTLEVAGAGGSGGATGSGGSGGSMATGGSGGGGAGGGTGGSMGQGGSTGGGGSDSGGSSGDASGGSDGSTGGTAGSPEAGTDAPVDGPACPPGFTDCNGRPEDGCEVNLSNDVDNCGRCDRACSTANVQTRVCSGGNCAPVCKSGDGDCTTPAVSAADNGCETGTTQNAQHCGTCGHSCQGGTCAASKCQVLTLASGESSPFALAIDASWAYWRTTYGGIRRARTTGGGVSDFEFPGPTIGGTPGIATNGTHVYWMHQGDPFANPAVPQRVYRRPVNMSSPSEVFYTSPATQAYMSLVADSTNVYAADYPGNTIDKIAISTRTATALTPNASSPRNMQVVSGFAYYDSVNDNIVRRVNINGPTTQLPQPVSPADVGPAFAVYSGYLYYTVATGIFRVPVAGGAPQQLFPFASLNVRSMAADASGVYFAIDVGARSDLRRMPLAGANPEPLVTGRGYLRDIKLDANSVYWADGGPTSNEGAVLKLAK